MLCWDWVWGNDLIRTSSGSWALPGHDPLDAGWAGRHHGAWGSSLHGVFQELGGGEETSPGDQEKQMECQSCRLQPRSGYRGERLRKVTGWLFVFEISGQWEVRRDETIKYIMLILLWLRSKWCNYRDVVLVVYFYNSVVSYREDWGGL